jgi:hypothetical protein
VATTTIRIMHEDKVITSFVCERYEHSEYDIPWHEVAVVSDRWRETDAKLRITEGRSTRHGVPPGMLEKQQHAPHYYGVAYLERGADSPVKLSDGPSQWSFPSDPQGGKPLFSTLRDGEKLPGGEAVVRIKYQFPDGGSPIWHRTVVVALDAIISAPAEEWSAGVTLHMLRRVTEHATRRGDAY